MEAVRPQPQTSLGPGGARARATGSHHARLSWVKINQYTYLLSLIIYGFHWFIYMGLTVSEVEPGPADSVCVKSSRIRRVMKLKTPG